MNGTFLDQVNRSVLPKLCNAGNQACEIVAVVGVVSKLNRLVIKLFQ